MMERDITALKKPYLKVRSTLTSPPFCLEDHFRLIVAINGLLDSPFNEEELDEFISLGLYDDQVRIAALQHLPPDSQEVSLLARGLDTLTLQLAAIAHQHQSSPSESLAIVTNILHRTEAARFEYRDPQRRQKTLRFLASFETPEADQLFADFLASDRATFDVWVELEDILLARPQIAPKELRDAFRKRVTTAHLGPNPEDRLIEYSAGGDPEKGLELFHDPKKGNCSRCPGVRIDNDIMKGPLIRVFAQNEGPKLLRDIIAPDHSLTTYYGLCIVTLKTGDLLSGMPIGDTDTTLTLETVDGETIGIPKNEIATRTNHSPMPSALLTLKPSEIRDVIAYLHSYAGLPLTSDK